MKRDCQICLIVKYLIIMFSPRFRKLSNPLELSKKKVSIGRLGLKIKILVTCDEIVIVSGKYAVLLITYCFGHPLNGFYFNIFLIFYTPIFEL